MAASAGCDAMALSTPPQPAERRTRASVADADAHAAVIIAVVAVFDPAMAVMIAVALVIIGVIAVLRIIAVVAVIISVVVGTIAVVAIIDVAIVIGARRDGRADRQAGDAADDRRTGRVAAVMTIAAVTLRVRGNRAQHRRREHGAHPNLLQHASHDDLLIIKQSPNSASQYRGAGQLVARDRRFALHQAGMRR